MYQTVSAGNIQIQFEQSRENCHSESTTYNWNWTWLGTDQTTQNIISRLACYYNHKFWCQIIEHQLSEEETAEMLELIQSNLPEKKL